MITWAVANQKGGVGKTTSVVTLGGLLADWGFNTLVVDLDPHGSLTSYFGYDPDSITRSTYCLFEEGPIGPVANLVQQGPVDRLSILPASTALATIDRKGAQRDGLGLMLKAALSELHDRYAYVLVDCPPMLGVLMVNALAACDHLIIPVQTEFLALKGLERMLHTLSMIGHGRHMPLEYMILPTMFDRRTRASSDTLEVLQARYADHLADLVIPVDTGFREASRMGLPISATNRKSRGAIAYQDFLDLMLGVESNRRRA